MRRAARRDVGEHESVQSLRKLGYLVIQATFPDLIIKNPRSGEVTLVEYGGITKNRRRDKRQLDLLTLWRIPIVKSLDEALRILGG